MSALADSGPGSEDGSTFPDTRVRITPEAQDFVQEKGGAVMLRSTLKHGCCGGRVELVKADLGEPRPAHAFRRVEMEGIVLFAEEGLLTDLGQPVTIGLDRFMGLRSLFVSGTDTRM
jgi:hypothetical protein